MIFRKKVRSRAATDPRYQEALRKACKDDILFWLSAFCWCFEPRDRVVNGRKLPHWQPFIPWDHQVPVIQAIDQSLGMQDIGINKSRGEGASWIGILFCLHRWLFYDDAVIGMVSRNELMGDNPDDPDSLFWKIDRELEKLPLWMAGESGKDWVRSVSKHTLRNNRNGAYLASYAATGDVASGGRKLFMLIDELAKFPRPADEEAMASTEPATDSRLIVSTPKGSTGAYYDIMHEHSGMKKIVLSWQDNPTRNRGLYKFEKGKPVAIDPVNNPLPPEYASPTPEVLDRWARLRRRGFNLDKANRSPWYDERCDRPKMTPQFMAQEYDRDFGGSSYRVFGEEVMSKTDEAIRDPVRKGAIWYDQETLAPDFELKTDGQVKLWCPVDARNHPPDHNYALGADVSTGQGGSYTSNSVVVVLDLDTREQVLEYATNTVEPMDFADQCIALAKMFHNAYLAWEHMGPGTAFTTRVLERGYGNIYHRVMEDMRTKKKTKRVGYVMGGGERREAFFGGINSAIRHDGWQIRSHDLREEFPQYVYGERGEIIHQQAKSTDDVSSQGKAHGDRVIALGVALIASKDRTVAPVRMGKVQPSTAKPGTMAWRAQAGVKKKDGWDWRSTSQLASGRK